MEHKKKIRWGILGCGRIARKFASDLQWVANAALVAVASRSMEQANAFAIDFPVPHVHGDYVSLVKNPHVDVIYIATPHVFHFEHTILCLNHQKAVLCEKPFAMNLRQATEMIALAKEKKVFLMEAFWTRFLPHYLKAKELIDIGTIGTIQYLHAEFGFKPGLPFPERLYDPALGGGALLDIGVYPVFLALDMMGKPDQIEAVMSPAATGVDEQCAIRFSYKNGSIAQLFCTFSSNLASGADICGNAGRIRMTERFHGPTAQMEFYGGTIDTRQSISSENVSGFGYQYEARHVTECLQMGLTESPVMTHDFTLLITETIDAIREKAGIYYVTDK